jgi:hypothetical protein
METTESRAMSPIGYAGAFWESFPSPIYWAILTIIGVVIGGLAVYYLLRVRGKPRLFIQTLVKGDNLGFGVSVERNMIKDARVRCNDINYFWEDGTRLERKDLYVGDAPSSFFPYRVNVEYVNHISEHSKWTYEDETRFSGGVLITVKEMATQKTVHVEGHPIPKNVMTPVVFARSPKEPIFDASIRIIGEGVEEKRDYSLNVGLNSLIVPAIKEGKPLMDYVSFSFELKKKSFFR